MAVGYTGKILNVDLSTGRIWEERLEEKLQRDFIGGYGVGSRILFSRQRAGVDPLGPDNMLGFVTGPITGSPLPFAGRWGLVAKSPLTGTWGDANCGGSFGPYLKFAGYDAVFFIGTSEMPVYLLIDEGKAELRDAGHLWGKDTYATEDMLQSEVGKQARVACIGPAGEKLSLISCVIHNKESAAARSGLGAVMGAKKLKAVAVNGPQGIPVADKEKIVQLRRRFIAGLSGKYFQILKEYGTVGIMRSWVAWGITPIKNFAGDASDFPDAYLKIGHDPLIKYQRKKTPCWRCPIGCKGHLKAGEGEYQWAAGVGKPEYETLTAFGTKCLNGNLESIIKANDICNRYGIDTSSAGATMAFAIECYENGVIGPGDTGGIELTWGNHQAIVTMLGKMAKREGFGDILADGSKVAAEKIGGGAGEYAMHIQGQEPTQDPKGAPSFATVFKMDATPSRHMQGGAYYLEQGVVPGGLDIPMMKHRAYRGKGEANRKISALHHVVNACGFCLFGLQTGAIDIEGVADSLEAVVGWSYNADDILEAGDRIASVRQAFNIREGLNPLEFKVPDRMIGKPPQQKGPNAGVTVDADALVEDYLRAMDWDLATAKPSKKRLVQLGLEDIAEALWP